MKKLITQSEKCTGCGKCEEVCSKTYFKRPGLSAIQIKQENGSCRIEVCDQCGDCAKMCSSLAVAKANNGVVRIAKDKCTGCLICVAECLRGFMHYRDEEPVPFKCLACGICVKECSAGALALS